MSPPPTDHSSKEAGIGMLKRKSRDAVILFQEKRAKPAAGILSRRPGITISTAPAPNFPVGGQTQETPPKTRNVASPELEPRRPAEADVKFPSSVIATGLEQAVSPAAANPSSTGAEVKPSSRTLKLRKKHDSSLAGGKDVPLQPVNNPVCYNCRGPFKIDDSSPLLARIACPRCGAKQVVPALVDHFILERELGEGGMGITYRAFDQHLQRNVAVKLISQKRTGRPGDAEALIREARRAATLVHPNIVPIYSIGSVDGRPYLVMELLSDTLLLRPLTRGVSLDETFVLETGLAITKALEEAHRHGILHLDIKPANILHDRFGVAKLIDFGLACHHAEGGNSGWGTCLYMAPERLRDRGQDFRSDQYSLGLTLWQALAGRAPFEAPDMEKLVDVILTQQPPILNHLRPELMEWTAGLIHKMMSPDPSRRYQDYTQLIRGFELVLNHLRWAASPEATADPQAP